jgi:hypothetical protein
MNEPPSPAEAAALLSEIESARTTMRKVVRAHRGHFHLWIWGAIWVAMPLSVQFGGERADRFFPWLTGAGVLASIAVGAAQGRQIKARIEPRFIGMIGALVLFAALFPLVLQARFDLRSLYAYICLVVMQAYVVAGLWTDSYLLWLGLLIAALILTGLFWFPGIFWLWMAVCGGGSLLLTGFYVRHFWR